MTVSPRSLTSENPDPRRRSGLTNNLMVLGGVAAIILVGLGTVLFRFAATDDGPDAESLMLYCAAGIRKPVEDIVEEYEKEYGVKIQIQPGGSNTLLGQVEASKTGDLYIAADMNYIRKGREKGLIEEAIPIATMRPVIVVAKGNPKNITSIDDLLRDDVKTALGSPDQAAVGRKTKRLLEASGHWEQINAHVTETGTFKPTVPDVANAVKLGSVDAAVIWDTTAFIYKKDLDAVETPELNAGVSDVMISVLASSKHPTSALRFARYLTARDKGLKKFEKWGFQVAEGDKWEKSPEITFYCGSVNNGAVDGIVQEFEKREGVTVNTIYNGCGILTGQMKTIREQKNGQGFPDTYMACDRYYLDTVIDWFQEDVDVSKTEIVIAVPKGNPKNIKSLEDLTKPGMRITVGQPDQCTIGVLTRQLFEAEGVAEAIQKNIVDHTSSSALLVPTVLVGGVDATLAFYTDTLEERNKLDVIRLDTKAAQAVQPFGIARSSDHKQLARRLYRKIASSREVFEEKGFNWLLDDSRQKTLQQP